MTIEPNSNGILVGTNLTKRYTDTLAVDGINFSISQNECYGFLGPNGAGKTSTMKMIHCLSPVTSGTLRVAGMDVMTEARRVKSILGVVPQEQNLDPDLTVIENLIVYARYFNIPLREARKRGEEYLDFFQLANKSNSKIKELSGGMKQRLLIARGLINRPDILILDEPTTGLDPQARHMIWQKIRRLKKEGITIVLTTHYMEEASQLCDRVAIMDRGKILVEGDPAKLVEERVGKDVFQVWCEGCEKEELTRDMERFDFSFEQVGDIIYIFSRNGDEALKALISKKYKKFLHRPAALEDLFLKLTGRRLRD